MTDFRWPTWSRSIFRPVSTATREPSPATPCTPITPSRSPRRSHARRSRPRASWSGKLHVAPIGSPPDLYEETTRIWLALSEPRAVRALVPSARARFEQRHLRPCAGDRGWPRKNGRGGHGGHCGAAGGSGTVYRRLRGIGDQRHRLPRARDHDRTAGGNRRRRHLDALAGRSGSLGRILEGKNVIAMGPGHGPRSGNRAIRAARRGRDRRRRWWWMPMR